MSRALFFLNILFIKKFIYLLVNGRDKVKYIDIPIMIASIRPNIPSTKERKILTTKSITKPERRGSAISKKGIFTSPLSFIKAQAETIVDNTMFEIAIENIPMLPIGARMKRIDIFAIPPMR